VGVKFCVQTMDLLTDPWGEGGGRPDWGLLVGSSQLDPIPHPLGWEGRVQLRGKEKKIGACGAEQKPPKKIQGQAGPSLCFCQRGGGDLGWLEGCWLASSLLAGPPPPGGRRVAIFLSKSLVQPHTVERLDALMNEGSLWGVCEGSRRGGGAAGRAGGWRRTAPRAAGRAPPAAGAGARQKGGHTTDGM